MRRSSIALLALCLSTALLLSACSDSGKPKNKKETQNRKEYSSDSLIQMQEPEKGSKIAIFNTSMGEIRAVLYSDLAPMAVDNFIGLAEDDYYDGQEFQRVIYGFVAQTGDAGGSGLSGASIWHNNPYPVEPTEALHHFSGALCMAHSGDDDETDTCLSQFYFVQSLPNMPKNLVEALEKSDYSEDVKEAYKNVGGLPYLDYNYTVFGQIYSGMEVLDAIGAVDTDENDTPLEPITIESVKIRSYGEND